MQPVTDGLAGPQAAVPYRDDLPSPLLSDSVGSLLVFLDFPAILSPHPESGERL